MKLESVFNLLNLALSFAHIDISTAFLDALFLSLILMVDLDHLGLEFMAFLNLFQNGFMGLDTLFKRVLNYCLFLSNFSLFFAFALASLF
jgi:hypothetical protein